MAVIVVRVPMETVAINGREISRPSVIAALAGIDAVYRWECISDEGATMKVRVYVDNPATIGAINSHPSVERP